MAIPAMAMALGKVFSMLSGVKSLSKTDEQENKLNFNGRQSNQNTPTIGDAVVDAMGGQQSMRNQQQQQMPQQQPGGGWDKFQSGAGKAMTIANLLGSLKGNDQQPQPYQMQLNNRYRR